jgi:monothiol glutaredoxin
LDWDVIPGVQKYNNMIRQQVLLKIARTPFTSQIGRTILWRTLSTSSLAGMKHSMRVVYPNQQSFFTTSIRHQGTSDDDQKADIPKRVKDLIDGAIKKHGVVLFMKGTPGWPQCGFSRLVVQILDLSGVKYHAIDVLEDQDLRQGLKAFSDWPTIPQLYVKGEFIGGADIVRNMYESGEFQDLMTGHGLIEPQVQEGEGEKGAKQK